jgi:hypothetical protein
MSTYNDGNSNRRSEESLAPVIFPSDIKNEQR